MNKQMTPAEIEFVQQSFARFTPISEAVGGKRRRIAGKPAPF